MNIAYAHTIVILAVGLLNAGVFGWSLSRDDGACYGIPAFISALACIVVIL